jgi:hypothetical protein
MHCSAWPHGLHVCIGAWLIKVRVIAVTSLDLHHGLVYWTKLHNEDIPNLFSSQDFIRSTSPGKQNVIGRDIKAKHL